MHLHIEQSTGQIETVGTAVINKLYELAYTDGVTPQLDNSSILIGRLHTSGAHKYKINYLQDKYDQLYISADKEYLQFVDPEVDKICSKTWGDGVGTTLANLQNVTSIATDIFQGNNDIEYFPEFATYFPSVINLQSNPVRNCTNLKSIDLSKIQVIQTVFSTNKALESLGDHEFQNIVRMTGEQMFAGVPAEFNLDMPNLTNGGTVSGIPYVFTRGQFYNCGVVHVKNLGNVTGSLQDTAYQYNVGAFRNCKKLKSFVMPAGVLYTSLSTFYECTNMDTLVFLGPTRAEYGREEWGTLWVPITCKVYMPDHIIPDSQLLLQNGNTKNKLSEYPDDGYEWIVVLRDKYKQSQDYLDYIASQQTE